MVKIMTISKNDLRAERLQKLRDSLKAELSRRGLTSLTYSDATLLGVPVKALHFQEIKTDIDKINPKLYEKAPVADEQIKDESISSLESIVTNLANNPKVGGSTSCSGGCVGLCVSCSGTCEGSCTSCNGCSGCSGGCTSCSGCRGTCGNSCRGGCISGCNSCIHLCDSTCVSNCGGGCWSGCSGTCVRYCNVNCGGGCTGGSKTSDDQACTR